MRKFMFGFPVVAAALVVFAAPASAGPPMPASGGFSYTVTNGSVRPAGTNLFIDYAPTPVDWTGTFTGTSVYLEGATYVFHADGSFQFSTRVKFEGTVAGCGSGTVVFQTQGNASVDAADGRVHWMPHHNHFTALFGQGTLPVHATLDVTGLSDPGGGSGTVAYSGQYDC